VVFATQNGKLDNAALTGESEPVALTTECTDPNHFETRNLALFGTLLTDGTVQGMVFATGDETVMAQVGVRLMNAVGLVRLA
jgi:sodium/potassium-transporting ATPase subunit alpha